MKTHKSSSGFTLVEVLVAIGIAAIVLISLNSVTTGYLHVSQRGRYLNLANSFAEAKIEALRNVGFDSLTDGTTSLTSELPTQLPRTRSAAMTVTTPTAGIKQVYLTVSYFDNGQTKEYKYTTYIGELGVGQ